MIPDSQFLTIGVWVGGFEDLIRRRFIRDLGHKGEAFEVTREGHEALTNCKAIIPMNSFIKSLVPETATEPSAAEVAI